MFSSLAIHHLASNRDSRKTFEPTIRRLSVLLVCFTLSTSLAFCISGCGSSSAHKEVQSSLPHSVTLNWTASVSKGVGYRVYRATRSGGPYTIVQMAPIYVTSFTDSTVQAGQTYFYVVTSVDKVANESAFSKEISVKIPTP
jgi:hypothetical protein